LTQQNNGESVILTFFPHPRMVLFPDDNDLKLLNTIEERIDLLKKAGINNLIIQPFTKDFSRLSAVEFIRDVLVNQIGVNDLVIGYDHHFGKNREGSLEQLQECAPLYRFKVEEIPAKEVQQINVSSTKIRNSLLTGEIFAANQFLGYNYFIEGTVIEGEKIGRTIGFPTANIALNQNYKLLPADGVYAVRIYINSFFYKGMLNIGKPIFKQNKHSIEVHIFDFNEDIYNKSIKIEFIAKIRNKLKFKNLNQLKSQLQLDKKEALQILH